MRQIVSNDSIYVVVPLERIKRANILFTKYEEYQKQVADYEKIAGLFQANVNVLNQEIIAYDSLVKVLDRKIILSSEVSNSQSLHIRAQDKTIRRLKVGLVGTLTVVVITAILRK